jgi:hypothetical protein
MTAIKKDCSLNTISVVDDTAVESYGPCMLSTLKEVAYWYLVIAIGGSLLLCALLGGGMIYFDRKKARDGRETSAEPASDERRN